MADNKRFTHIKTKKKTTQWCWVCCFLMKERGLGVYVIIWYNWNIQLALLSLLSWYETIYRLRFWILLHHDITSCLFSLLKVALQFSDVYCNFSYQTVQHILILVFTQLVNISTFLMIDNNDHWILIWRLWLLLSEKKTVFYYHSHHFAYSPYIVFRPLNIRIQNDVFLFTLTLLAAIDRNADLFRGNKERAW